MLAYRVPAQAFLALCIVAMTFLGGCGGAPSRDYSGLELVDVSGTVTLDGQPLAGAMVVFADPEGSTSRGMTDASGVYQLEFSSDQSGVTPGPKTVTVTVGGSPSSDEEDGGEVGGEGLDPSSPVEGRQSWQVEVTVSSGGAQTHDLALTAADASAP